MKKKGIVFFLPVVLLAAFAGSGLFAQTKDYSVGDIGPAGGIIFFDSKEINFGGKYKYLEAAPVSSEFSAAWGPVTKIVFPERQSTVDIFTGMSNTDIIIKATGNAVKTSAAAQCRGLKIKGPDGKVYTDWYLPSSIEISYMYFNLRQKDRGGFKDDFYWTSTQSKTEDSIAEFRSFDKNIGNNGASTARKNSVFRVRAIRAF